MLLTLVLIVQMCSTIHGYEDLGKNIIKVNITETCVAYLEKVSADWTVAKGCYMTCSPNGTSVPVDFPDERLCAASSSSPGSQGAGVSSGRIPGSFCLTPEALAPMPTKSGPFCSPPKTTLHEEENIATECTQRCFDESPPRLTYERKKYNVTNGVKCLGKNRKVGTCQYGTCSGQYQEGECKRKMLAVYSRTNVVEKCMRRCNNGSDIQVENGTMCALQTPTRNWFWSLISSAKTFVEEIGICHSGTCIHRGKYDEKYNATQEDSTKDCQGTDIVINENLTVASPCTALCNDGRTAPRKEKILCLYQFFREDSHDIYRVGECHCGICEPRDDYFVTTKRGDPKDYKQPSS
ncbi:unnamed protein product [Ixodes persulcatus]